jgi:hypothetical protein
MRSYRGHMRQPDGEAARPDRPADDVALGGDAGQTDRPAGDLALGDDEQGLMADRRDRVADRRERDADERDRVADERERIADERETKSDAREAHLQGWEADLAERGRRLRIGTDRCVDFSLKIIEAARASLTRSEERLNRSHAALIASARRSDREQSTIDRETARSDRRLRVTKPPWIIQPIRPAQSAEPTLTNEPARTAQLDAAPADLPPSDDGTKPR